MKTSTSELIKTERRYNDYSFITEIIQRGRHKPEKYRHFLKMPFFLYQELCEKRIIDWQDYYLDETAFFEADQNLQTMTISFITLFAIEDLHRKIDRYLIVKFAGSYPLERGGQFNI